MGEFSSGRSGGLPETFYLIGTFLRVMSKKAVILLAALVVVATALKLRN
ncbi:hypothetical protein [Halosimplex salinum]|nr:hypothetical protein [Halosimplex salinum]